MGHLIFADQPLNPPVMGLVAGRGHFTVVIHGMYSAILYCCPFHHLQVVWLSHVDKMHAIAMLPFGGDVLYVLYIKICNSSLGGLRVFAEVSHCTLKSVWPLFHALQKGIGSPSIQVCTCTIHTYMSTYLNLSTQILNRNLYMNSGGRCGWWWWF